MNNNKWHCQTDIVLSGNIKLNVNTLRSICEISTVNEENIFNNLCTVLNLMGNFDRLRRDFKIINSTNPRLF